MDKAMRARRQLRRLLALQIAQQLGIGVDYALRVYRKQIDEAAEKAIDAAKKEA